MMAKVFSLLFVLALCFGAAGGKLEQVSAALPQGAAGGVELAAGWVVCPQPASRDSIIASTRASALNFVVRD